MYCKKCGKEISEDSIFCQYCGEQLFESRRKEKREWKGPITWFKSLSHRRQVCLMAYVCWVLFWLVISAINAIDEDLYDKEFNFLIILVFVIVIPVLTLFVWYYRTHIRTSKEGNQHVKNHMDELNSDYVMVPLLQFAEKFGKMQVSVERVSNGESVSYCTFTKVDGSKTRVEFSTNTLGMTATDISMKKDRLFVVRFSDASYKLIEL